MGGAVHGAGLGVARVSRLGARPERGPRSGQAGSAPVASRARLPRRSSTRAPARGGCSGAAGEVHPSAARLRRPVPAAWVGDRGRGGSAPGCAPVRGAGAGRERRPRRIARRAAAWTLRAMAAPEPAPRRGREREREDESEDESDILEESPCGRWQKRREQVGTAGCLWGSLRPETSPPPRAGVLPLGPLRPGLHALAKNLRAVCSPDHFPTSLGTSQQSPHPLGKHPPPPNPALNPLGSALDTRSFAQSGCGKGAG